MDYLDIFIFHKLLFNQSHGSINDIDYLDVFMQFWTFLFFISCCLINHMVILMTLIIELILIIWTFLFFISCLINHMVLLMMFKLYGSINACILN
jgi:hypothetical protein